MMIFASDLDQTLIYSKKHIGDCKNYVLVEKIGDEEISYVSLRAVDLLKEISQRIFFVPVTTRTVEQYERISLFKDVIKPQYAVVSNGGTILVNGQRDTEWDDHIRSTTLVYHKDSIYGYVEQEVYKLYEPDMFRVARICDELFWVFVAYEDIEVDDRFATLGEKFGKIGWQTCIQGRKMYAIPEVIDKFKALQYIMKKTNSSNLFVSGDSSLDYSMLKNGDKVIIPGHGKVISLLKTQEINITVRTGMLAGEEILDFVLSNIR